MSNRARALALVAFTASMATPVFAACEWPAAKKDIETVLDHDPAKGEEFRKQAKAGRDTLDAIDKLVDAAARERIRACGYEAGEFLTQRGFPPLH